LVVSGIHPSPAIHYALRGALTETATYRILPDMGALWSKDLANFIAHAVKRFLDGLAILAADALHGTHMPPDKRIDFFRLLYGGLLEILQSESSGIS
jgi:hypothetical protein